MYNFTSLCYMLNFRISPHTEKIAVYFLGDRISRLIGDMMADHSQACGDVNPRFPEIKHLSHPTCIVCLCGSHGC